MALLLVLLGMPPRAEAIGPQLIEAEPPVPVEQPLPLPGVSAQLSAYRAYSPPHLIIVHLGPSTEASSDFLVVFMRTSTRSAWLGYRSEWRDQSGLTYLRHRYMDPTLGRFTQSDPAQAGSNWYGYAGGDPVNNIDPMGTDYFAKEGNTWYWYSQTQAQLGSKDYTYKWSYGQDQNGFAVRPGGHTVDRVQPLIDAAGPYHTGDMDASGAYRTVLSAASVTLHAGDTGIPSPTRFQQSVTVALNGASFGLDSDLNAAAGEVIDDVRENGTGLDLFAFGVS